MAQGIDTALCEEMRVDADGQPLSATLADYLLPGAADVPPLRTGNDPIKFDWSSRSCLPPASAPIA